MKTNILKKTAIASLLVGGMFLGSCTDGFTNMNTDPAVIPETDPMSLLFKTELVMFSQGTTWTDSYRYKIRWMQYCSGIWGFNVTSQYIAGFGGGVYSEYINTGKYVTHIDYLISQDANPDRYSDLSQVARILLISKGIHATDAQGSLAYSDAWRARGGDNSEEALFPKFQPQEELFPIWDAQLKECIEKLKNKPTESQESMQGPDRSYGGKTDGWIKAANALRLRIAVRLMKRMPDLSTEIATEVLAAGNIANTMASIDDSFIQYYDNTFMTYNGGDWHSIKDMDRASAPFMRYLKKYNDPRMGIFFRINDLTAENVAAYNALQENSARLIPSDFTRWEGGTVNPSKTNEDPRFLDRSLKLKSGETIDMRAMNRPQTRLWKGEEDKGAGGYFNPILTYADFCFMAAEFVLDKNISSPKSAEQWYTDGVRASVKQWDKLADFCKNYDYERAISDVEIENFLQQNDIKWNASMGLEQIYTQAWVEHLKNNNESWAQWKRVGFPNENGKIVQFDPIVYIDGTVPRIPRRVRFEKPLVGSNNYENILDRFEQMSKYPEFGKDLQDEFGRVWWEK